MTRPDKITVFGAGVWGTVLAQHLALKGNNVCLWEFHEHLLSEILDKRRHPHIPNFTLAPGIKLTHSLDEAVAGAELLLLAISAKSARKFFAGLAQKLDGAAPPLISASKGIETNTLATVCEVAESELPQLKGKAAALSGPSFALEVARGVPTKIILAGGDAALLEKLRAVLDGEPLRLELSSDRKGVEWGGAVKNVLAIGCGILDGLGAGANTKAAMITLGIREMESIITSAGGKTETVYGLAGLGDFILTGTSDISRNRRLGQKLGAGKAVTQARGEINTVAEGADSAESVRALAARRGVRAPLTEAVWRIIHEGAAPDLIMKALGFQ